jgi:mannitol/fructose-specific phosphotransferase system IIA component (Ntr-type)
MNTNFITENIRLDEKPATRHRLNSFMPRKKKHPPKVSDFLNPSKILIDLNGKSKLVIIENLVNFLADEITSSETDQIVLNLMEREALKSTAVGGGFAIPHCSCDHLKNIEVLLGISQAGLDFDAVDGQHVYLFFLVLTPRKFNLEYLNLVASIVHLIRESNFGSDLLLCNNAQDVIKFIAETESAIPKKTAIT